MARRDGKYRGTYRGVTEQRERQPLRGQVNLLCGHTMFYSQPVPRVGDDVLCNRCRVASSVISVEDEIRVRCTDCRYSRGFGQAELTADTYASKHAVMRGHVVHIVKGSTLIAVKGDKSPQVELPFPDDPPF